MNTPLASRLAAMILNAAQVIVTYTFKQLLCFTDFGQTTMTIVMKGGQSGVDAPQDAPTHQGTTQVPPTGPQNSSGPQPSGSVTVTEEVAPADVSIDLVDLKDDQEPDFPVVELGRLDEMINRPRWVVPVLPKGELEVLLDAAIKLCKEGK